MQLLLLTLGVSISLSYAYKPYQPFQAPPHIFHRKKRLPDHPVDDHQPFQGFYPETCDKENSIKSTACSVTCGEGVTRIDFYCQFKGRWYYQELSTTCNRGPCVTPPGYTHPPPDNTCLNTVRSRWGPCQGSCDEGGWKMREKRCYTKDGRLIKLDPDYRRCSLPGCTDQPAPTTKVTHHHSKVTRDRPAPTTPTHGDRETPPTRRHHRPTTPSTEALLVNPHEEVDGPLVVEIVAHNHVKRARRKHSRRRNNRNRRRRKQRLNNGNQ